MLHLLLLLLLLLLIIIILTPSSSKVANDFIMGQAYAVKLSHTGVFEKARHCVKVLDYEKVNTEYLLALFVDFFAKTLRNIPPPQVGEVEDFSVGKFTRITTSALQKLRGLRPGYKCSYKTTSPSKQKEAFV